MALITRAYAEAIAKAREEAMREIDRSLPTADVETPTAVPKKRRIQKKKRSGTRTLAAVRSAVKRRAP